jgi:hypothetical protein
MGGKMMMRRPLDDCGTLVGLRFLNLSDTTAATVMAVTDG